MVFGWHRVRFLTLPLLLVFGTSPVLQSAIASAAARQIAPTRVFAQSSTEPANLRANRLLQQGTQQFRDGQYPTAEATLQQALDLYRQGKNRVGEAQALTQLSEVYYWFGQSSQALEVAQSALTIWRELKNRKGEGEALERIGEAYSGVGDYTKALEILQQALTIRRQVTDRLGEGKTLVRIGAIAYKNKQSTKALEALQEAQTILQKEGDRFEESLALGWIGWALFNQGDKTRGFATLEAALKLSRNMNNGAESNALLFIGYAYSQQKEYAKALEFYQQVLTILQRSGKRISEAYALKAIADAYRELGQHSEALEYYQQALVIHREFKNRKVENPSAEGDVLNNMGIVYDNLGQYPKALDYYQQALVIHREFKNRVGEGVTLGNIGTIYNRLRRSSEALDYHQQALAIYRELKDRSGEGNTLNQIGVVYHDLDQYPKALEYYQQALAIHQEVKNRVGEGVTLGNIGRIYNHLGKSSEALDYHQQALAIDREVKNRVGEGDTLNQIGIVYKDLGQYLEALKYHQQALVIYRELKNRQGEGNALNNIGLVYSNLGQYPEALNYYQQALAIYRELKNRSGEGTALNNIGVVYDDLGEYPKALEFLQQALVIDREVKDRSGESTNLNNIAGIYNKQKQYAKALEYYQQVLTLLREIKSRKNEGRELNNIGDVYDSLGQYPKALEYYQQALVINREVKDRSGEGTTLNNIGQLYRNLRDYPKALEYFQQALIITREVGERLLEGIILSNIGYMLDKQKQPELAIIFFKQSVNVRESIRKNNRQLPREQQESYTKTVANTYRHLADLLISQGRIGEAQQVLELLKVQELNDFTRGTRAPDKIASVGFSATETQIRDKYGSLIAFGTQFYNCEQTHCVHFAELKSQYNALRQDFYQLVEDIKKQLREGRLVQVANGTEDFKSSAARFVEAQPRTVLIYPLVLEDKVRLLWASKGGVLDQAVCDLTETELNRTVSTFQELLSRPTTDVAQVKATGKKLYDCLIKPLEPELQKNQIQHLVFVPDRVTNYIPMAALFDGKQYLIERYQVSNILSAGLTDITEHLPTTQQAPILGLGLSEAKPGLSALTNVPSELNAIIKTDRNDRQGIYPGQKFLNQAFTRDALENNMRGSKIVHIATHAKFEPTNPRDSYLILGTGEKYPIYEIESLRGLENVHLVVLSACETARGGSDRNGLEVAGISSYFVRNKAKAVIASLWEVNDMSTSLLMQQMYENLAKGTTQSPITKAEALRQAQLMLLKNPSLTKTDANRTALHPNEANQETRRDNQPSAPGFTHPFYWAPFILIGNSL